MSAIPSYRLSTSPGKGLGLFAARPIAVGELIISERPLFLARDEWEIYEELAELSMRDEDTFFALTDSHNPEHPTAATIMLTNGIPTDPQINQGGIFPIICRINHSCLPNSHYTWSPSARRMSVYADADILEGAEIVVSYIRPLLARSDRQAQLWESFNFACGCSACTGPPDPVSDSRRERIYELYSLVGMAMQYEMHVAGMQYTKERLRLMDEEGMGHLSTRSNCHGAGYVMAQEALDLDTARRHFAQSYAYALLGEGPDSEETTGRLRRYLSWRLKVEGKTGRVDTLPVICDRCGREGHRSLGETGGRGKDGGNRKGSEAAVAVGGGFVEHICECGSAVYCPDACRTNHAFTHQAVCEVLRETGMIALMMEGRWEVHGYMWKGVITAE
jgi:hypothetical protein